MDNDKKTAETGHENVMLLAMSTLPQRPKVNTYQFREEGGTVCFKSFSQMEPHTKYVLHMLAAGSVGEGDGDYAFPEADLELSGGI